MTFSSCRAAMAAACRWAAPTNGAISSTAWSSAGASITDLMFGLTTPLITTSGGAKMGKTAAGAVWLNPDRLSPYDYWQYWRDTSDADVGRFLRMFTDLPLDEIARLEALKGQEINAAKITLATEATAMAHGRAAADAAAETARQTFGEGGAGDDLPRIEVAAGDLARGIPAIELFHRSGLASSKERGAPADQGRRGAGERPGRSATRPAVLNRGDVTGEGYIKLSAGKKKHALVQPRLDSPITAFTSLPASCREALSWAQPSIEAEASHEDSA